jgi:seryl-tRNA synthetase
MHEIKWIRENTEAFDRAMESRGLEPISSKILELDNDKRQLLTIIQKLQHARKEKADLISKSANKRPEAVNAIKKDAQDIKEKLAQLELQLDDNIELEQYLSSLPNIPEIDVPVGPDETYNKVIRTSGIIKNFDFKPKQHFELGEKLEMLDFSHTSKISGSRFATLSKDLARLERALANFMLDVHTQKFGYEEISPPCLVRDEAMFGSGQLPKLDKESFSTTNGYRLIPTSEVSLVNLVAGKMLEAQTLPLRYVACTPCFRSEAGAAGKDTRGLMRMHQFLKVELVSITKAEDSAQELERKVNCAEEILKILEIPYRVILLSTGDMGFCSQKTYDIEVWLPGQNNYREISSCSNCGDFQGRRMKARYRNANDKNSIFVHTLNGSGLAVGRTIIAIMENYQNEDGSITIPKALRPYMDGKELIKKA